MEVVKVVVVGSDGGSGRGSCSGRIDRWLDGCRSGGGSGSDSDGGGDNDDDDDADLLDCRRSELSSI